MNPRSPSFCPHCQAAWDQPWHDVCPACGEDLRKTGVEDPPALLSRAEWGVVLGTTFGPAVVLVLVGIIAQHEFDEGDMVVWGMVNFIAALVGGGVYSRRYSDDDTPAAAYFLAAFSVILLLNTMTCILASVSIHRIN